jgi:hypothetical protein
VDVVDVCPPLLEVVPLSTAPLLSVLLVLVSMVFLLREGWLLPLDRN